MLSDVDIGYHILIVGETLRLRLGLRVMIIEFPDGILNALTELLAALLLVLYLRVNVLTDCFVAFCK